MRVVMEIVEAPSPNRGPRRGGALPDLVVLHYTGMERAEAALARLCDPAAEVSAHYLIAEDGRVWRMVPEADRAWHAGVSCWGGVADVNSRSIGIELANPGTGAAAHPFPEPQMAVLEGLLAGVLARWEIPLERVVGHSCVAPGRKIDPGPRFDWRRLAMHGLSVWLDAAPAAERTGSRPPTPPGRSAAGAASAPAFRAAARRFGYGLEAAGGWDAGTLAVWEAFALRFRPGEAGGAPTAAGVAHLGRLAAKWPCAGIDAGDPLR